MHDKPTMSSSGKRVREYCSGETDSGGESESLDRRKRVRRERLAMEAEIPLKVTCFVAYASTRGRVCGGRALFLTKNRPVPKLIVFCHAWYIPGSLLGMPCLFEFFTLVDTVRIGKLAPTCDRFLIHSIIEIQSHGRANLPIRTNLPIPVRKCNQNKCPCFW